MSQKQTFILAHETARARARQAVATAPAGHMVVISEPTKRRVQEEKYHAMLGDIAKQCSYIGRQWDSESWKRILVDAFAEEMRASGAPLHQDSASQVIPSTDGKRIVQLGIQTREFYVREASAFIEFLYAFGSQQKVQWSEPVWEAQPA